jgi:molybdopterin synthase catalytic subunit/molybdopterin converting factor small subunit
VSDETIPVTVRLFAGLREQAGWGTRAMELPAGARVRDVWAALALGVEPKGLLYARNKEYVEQDVALAADDEIALIPPVSGGSGTAPSSGRGGPVLGPFLLTHDPIDTQAVVAAASDDEAGAVAVFLGTVRRHSRGRTVLHLDYEGYDGMAEQCMAEIAGELAARRGLTRIAMTHRLGRVEIGEPSVVIAVSSPHRADALAACQEAIDALKVRAPLWKKEIYEGGEEWIGQGS